MMKAQRRLRAALGFKILLRLTLLTIIMLLYFYSWFLLYGELNNLIGPSCVDRGVGQQMSKAAQPLTLMH